MRSFTPQGAAHPTQACEAAITVTPNSLSGSMAMTGQCGEEKDQVGLRMRPHQARPMSSAAVVGMRRTG
jgi:hypothetical protein